jgi:hypothetical protein
MGSKVALKAIGILVLLPASLVAAFWSLLGVAALFDAIARPNPIYPYRGLALGLVLVAGWFGIVTLWQLYYHHNSDRPLGNIKARWAGLAIGCCASIALLVAVPGQWLAAWPLVATIYFVFRLQAYRAAA